MIIHSKLIFFILSLLIVLTSCKEKKIVEEPKGPSKAEQLAILEEIHKRNGVTTSKCLKDYKNKNYNITSCNLSGYPFKDISGIEKLTRLGMLDISNTLIESLPPLDSLKKLYIFRAENLPLKKYPKGLVSKKLISVAISNTHIDSIPDEISQLTSIDEARFNYNKLTYVSPELFSLPKLTYISLSGNKLKRINALPDANAPIIYIRLSRNTIEQFPISVAKIHSLDTLYLEGNNIQNIPDSIKYASHLKVLDLTANSLSALPDSLYKLINLEDLFLSANRFKSIPPQLLRLKNLESLFLGANDLSTVPKEINRLSNLKELSLSQCKFNVFPTELITLPAIELIYMRDNKLTSIPNHIINYTTLSKSSTGRPGLWIEGNAICSASKEIDAWLQTYADGGSGWKGRQKCL